MHDPLIAFAVAEIIAHGQAIASHRDRLAFYQGICRLADEAPELEPLREVVAQMRQNDAQLELLESQQRTLALKPAE